MSRLFFALLPNNHTRQTLQQLTAMLPLSSRQRVNPTLWHVTLLFIGQVDKNLLPDITEAARTVHNPMFTLCFDQLEYWRKSGILCLTCSRPEPLIHSLVTQLSKPLVDLGVNIDKRPFRPHLTLARRCQAKPDILYTPIPWFASDFALMESLSDVSGVFYRTLHRWSLETTMELKNF